MFILAKPTNQWDSHKSALKTKNTQILILSNIQNNKSG